MTEKTTKKAVVYSFMHAWLGEGLLVSGGPKWASRRKIITPTFHFSILESFVDVFNLHDTKLVEKMAKFAGTKEDCNVYDLFTAATLDIICGEF